MSDRTRRTLVMLVAFLIIIVILRLNERFLKIVLLLMILCF